MKNKILLIEDNKEISQNIVEYLEMEDFAVTAVYDGEGGIEKATREDFDIILLDLMLPKIDGLTIARRVQMKKSTPVLMMTARGSLDDKLQGFELGAVDYLVKPFDLKELLARIRVHLGKTTLSSQKDENGIYVFGDILFESKKHQIQKAGQEIHLTQKEYLLLELFFQRKNELLTRGEIIEALWGESQIYESSADNKLDVYISNLRNKLGKDTIKTIKGVGYILGD